MQKSVAMAICAAMLRVTIGAMSGGAAQAQVANSQPPSEAAIADLKARTEVLARDALSRLNTLNVELRLAAPPDIWKVPGAITEFKDCSECPQMVVIPAGDF